MNGRMQNELKIERSIEKKLEKMPSYVKEWHINLKASKRTASTRLDYINKIYRFLEYIEENPKNLPIEQINESNVSNYFLSIQTKKINGDIVNTSDSYQCSIWNCLNNFLEYLRKRGDIKNNYISLISKPKNRDLERINESRILLTEKEFKKILKAVKKEPNKTRKARDEAIVLLFMNTGMRKTALTNIMIDDLDFNKKILTITDKGNKRHQYELNETIFDALNNWLFYRNNFLKGKLDEHLFISDHGTSMNPNTVYDLVAKYTKAALGKPLSPHKLRAGYCSILYNKTHDAEFVRRAVGHANVATTQRYIVTKGDERKKASEIMGSIL